MLYKLGLEGAFSTHTSSIRNHQSLPGKGGGERQWCPCVPRAGKITFPALSQPSSLPGADLQALRHGQLMPQQEQKEGVCRRGPLHPPVPQGPLEQGQDGTGNTAAIQMTARWSREGTAGSHSWEPGKKFRTWPQSMCLPDNPSAWEKSLQKVASPQPEGHSCFLNTCYVQCPY